MNANIPNKNVIFIIIQINQTAQPFKTKFRAWWAHLKSPDCLSAAPDIIVILNLKICSDFFVLRLFLITKSWNRTKKCKSIAYCYDKRIGKYVNLKRRVLWWVVSAYSTQQLDGRLFDTKKISRLWPKDIWIIEKKSVGRRFPFFILQEWSYMCFFRELRYAWQTSFSTPERPKNFNDRNIQSPK